MVHDTSGALTAFPCNTCSLSFKNSLLQRTHMQSAWHINNLQRKILGQPALSEAEFGECVEKNTSARRKKSRHDDNNNVDISERDTHLETSSESDGHASETSDYNNHDMEQSGHSSKQTDTSLSPIQDSTRCLFCALVSPNVEENISHMSSAHSFFLPSASTSTAAVEPLLSYLSLLIYTYHECIYCAREKNSVHGVQSHMRDSAHCKLDVSLYEDFFPSGEDADSREEEEEEEEEEEQEEENNTTGTESDEGEEGIQEKTRRHNIRPSTADGAKKPLPRKTTRKERIQLLKPHVPHAQSTTSSLQQQAVTSDTTSLQTTTLQNSSLILSSSSPPYLPPLPLPPAPSNGRNSALSLAGLSNTQLVSLASLDKKMRRQQVSAQKRVNQLALRQPVKAIYYKTENPVYQAG